MSDHEIKHAAGPFPALIKTVLTAGAVAIGFEVAQQATARAYYLHAWRAYHQKKKSGKIPVFTPFQTSPSGELRSQWAVKLYEAMGGDHAFCLLKNPRSIPHNVRACIFRTSLWIFLLPTEREKFKSREEFYDFCIEVGGSIGALLITRRSKL